MNKKRELQVRKIIDLIKIGEHVKNFDGVYPLIRGLTYGMPVNDYETMTDLDKRGRYRTRNGNCKKGFEEVEKFLRYAEESTNISMIKSFVAEAIVKLETMLKPAEIWTFEYIPNTQMKVEGSERKEK